MSPLAVSLLVFLATGSAVAAAALVVRDLRGAAAASNQPDAAKPFRLQRLRPPPAVEDPGPIEAFDGWFAQLLDDAGLEWNPTATAAAILLFGALCGTLLFFFDERVLPAVLAGALTTPLPLVYLVFRRERRRAQLQDQLPPALETLARSMRAGQTLDRSIALLGAHSPEPMAGEFRWCARQMEMGLALPAVMRGLARRLRLYDVQLLATTLIVHRQTGGNVVTVLERLAQMIRDRLNYRRQLRATTAAGRMSAGLVAIVGPAVLVYFVFFQPDYADPMLRDPLGQAMLAVAVALEVVGLVWIFRLLKPKY